jgi:hypothetical protein
MNSIRNKKPEQKRKYAKPRLEQVQVDKEISMVMMSPPVDPESSMQPLQFTSNPFKMPNL